MCGLLFYSNGYLFQIQREKMRGKSDEKRNSEKIDSFMENEAPFDVVDMTGSKKEVFAVMACFKVVSMVALLQRSRRQLNSK